MFYKQGFIHMVCLFDSELSDFLGTDATSSQRMGSTLVFLCKCSCAFSGKSFNELQQTDVLNIHKKNKELMKHFFMLKEGDEKLH